MSAALIRNLLMEDMACVPCHDQTHHPYLLLTIHGKNMLFPLDSHMLNVIVRHEYRARNSDAQIKKKDVKEVFEELETRAILQGPMINPTVRVSGNFDSYEIDQGDNTFNVFKVTPEGWEVGQPNQPFLRKPGLLPMLEPVQLTPDQYQGVLTEFHALMNINENQFIMILAYLLMCLKPRGPYPVLAVQGEPGTGKSCLYKIIKALVDPNVTPHATFPKSERDLVIQAQSNWVMAFDNLSDHSFKKQESDWVARITTGVGFRIRKLYTNGDEVVVCLSRPVMLNGIDDITKQSDVASRAIVLRLEPIPDNKRTSEHRIQTQMDTVLPKMLGLLLDAVVYILANRANVQITSGARMRDMLEWVSAAEGFFGWEPGTFEKAFEENQAESAQVSIDADPVAEAIQSFMANREREEGTSTEVLGWLKGAVAATSLASSPEWPKSANMLTRRIDRIRTALARNGFLVTHKRGKQRTIEMVNTARFEQNSQAFVEEDSQ